MQDTFNIVNTSLLAVILILLTFILYKQYQGKQDISSHDINKQIDEKSNHLESEIEHVSSDLETKFTNLRMEFNSSITNMQTALSGLLNTQISEESKKEMEKIDLLIKTLSDQFKDVKVSVDANTTQTEAKLEAIRQNFTNSITNMQTALGQSLNTQISEQSKKEMEKIDLLIKTLTDKLENVMKSLNNNTTQTETKLESIRVSVEKSIKSLETENNAKLENIKNVVDEKLQKTLEEKLSRSFQMVNDSLAKVQTGLGEMQNLAAGVGDLKKVLSNVKTRGILGETQLGSILEQILSPEQYETNVVTKKGSKDPVEFAIKMPGGENGPIYLPVDAKFPLDTYSALLTAYDSGSADEIKAAKTNLITKIKKFGKDISEKYIDVPNTTDFGIMFLPVEGLYAEVVQTGVTEDLQRDYKINVAGPTTMAALLNSLQMGFKTLAIQKRSGEVWQILGAVKTEFNNFERVLTATQTKLDQASGELEKLVGVRTRQMQKKLKQVTVMPEVNAEELLSIDESSEESQEV